ncbi:hypothetical protein Hanom_Chr07g00598721 [Helianthus anomalus]
MNRWHTLMHLLNLIFCEGPYIPCQPSYVRPKIHCSPFSSPTRSIARPCKETCQVPIPLFHHTHQRKNLQPICFILTRLPLHDRSRQ